MKINGTKVFVVIPTIRDLNFLASWKNEFKECHLIVIEDRIKKTVKIPSNKFVSVSHYSWKEVDEDFGKNSWIFSRKNAGIRSYGFYKAYTLGADVVLTIDDDCYPDDKNFITQHLTNLNRMSSSGWVATYPNPKWMHTRGFPYKIRDKIKTGVSHGLWSGALDLDAKTESVLPRLLNEKNYPSISQHIPFGSFYPMCSMNLAFKKEMIPIMFFPMMGFDNKGKSWGFDRYDDIWAGIFSKKIMDHLRIGVINGSPFVDHRKASLAKHNMIKEFEGMKVNEDLWRAVDDVALTGSTPKECYIELAEKINFPKKKYFKKLRDAMIIWANLF